MPKTPEDYKMALIVVVAGVVCTIYLTYSLYRSLG